MVDSNKTSRLYANMTLQGDKFLQKLQDEFKKIKNLGVSEDKLKVIANFYRINCDITVGNVSKCLEYLIEILKLLDFNDEQIKDYINKNSNIYINEFVAFKNRIVMFNKCGRLRYIINNKPGLLSHCKKDTNNYIFDLLVSKNYKITEEELSNMFLEKDARVKTIKLS